MGGSLKMVVWIPIDSFMCAKSNYTIIREAKKKNNKYEIERKKKSRVLNKTNEFYG